MDWIIFGYFASVICCLTIFLIVRNSVREYITEAVENGEIHQDGTNCLRKIAIGYIFAMFCPLLNTVTVLMCLIFFERQNERLYEIVDESWGIED